MDAVEFLKQFNRMCNTYIYGRCAECPAYKYRCGDEFDEQEEDGVSIVEQWAKEHPIKTRQSELLKMFPNTDKNNGVLDFCPQRFGYFRGNSKCCESTTECAECKRDFWLKEIE